MLSRIGGYDDPTESMLQVCYRKCVLGNVIYPRVVISGGYGRFVMLETFLQKIKMRTSFSSQKIIASLFLITVLFTRTALAIRCYQCSSDTDKKNDVCGAYAPFDTIRNVPVECYSEEAKTPGIFCVKMVRQGPRGFVWDGRWRTVIRRCALVSETGVTTYCNWGHDENGVYWEECYCGTDGCNAASTTHLLGFMTVLPLAGVLRTLLFE